MSKALTSVFRLNTRILCDEKVAALTRSVFLSRRHLGELFIGARAPCFQKGRQQVRTGTRWRGLLEFLAWIFQLCSIQF